MTDATETTDVSTNEGYQAAMDLVAAQARAIRQLPVAELLEQVGRVETLGPILEPTAYQRGGADRLADQRKLLEALRRVQKVADEIAGAVDAEARR